MMRLLIALKFAALLMFSSVAVAQDSPPRGGQVDIKEVLDVGSRVSNAVFIIHPSVTGRVSASHIDALERADTELAALRSLSRILVDNNYIMAVVGTAPCPSQRMFRILPRTGHVIGSVSRCTPNDFTSRRN